MFAAEVSELHDVMTAVENAVFTPEKGDPRNLDPDDTPLEEMYAAAIRLGTAADKLKDAVSTEMSRRSALLDEMAEAEYDAWEARVTTARAGEQA